MTDKERNMIKESIDNNGFEEAMKDGMQVQLVHDHDFKLLRRNYLRSLESLEDFLKKEKVLADDKPFKHTKWH